MTKQRSLVERGRALPSCAAVERRTARSWNEDRMTIEELAILVPCHSLEDFPVYYRGKDADNLLSAWTAIWHPLLITARGQPPRWLRADAPPEPRQGAILAVPDVSLPALPSGYLSRADQERAVLLRGQTRESMLAIALEAVSASGMGCPSLAEELVADFLALGYCYLQVQLLTRRMRYACNLDEIQFGQHLVEAATAAVEGNEPLAREKLAHCYNLLSAERDHYYSVDVYLLDLTLVAPTTLGSRFQQELQQRQPVNLLLNGDLVQRLVEEQPASHQQLVEALAQRRCVVVGGGVQEGRWPLLDLEHIAAELHEGRARFQQLLGTTPSVFGRWRGGLTPLLPQLLSQSGFMAAVHVAFDGNRVPQGSQAKTRWEGLDGTAIDALTAPPLDAAEPGVFLELALKLGETMDMDHVATVCFAHWPGHVSRWYDELRRVALHTHALGRFYRLDAYFRDTMLPGRLDRFEATHYRYDYLRAAIIRQEVDPISRPMRYWRNVALVRAIEAYDCWASLLGQPPGQHRPPIGTDEQPAPTEPLLDAYRKTLSRLTEALTRGEPVGRMCRMFWNPLPIARHLCVEVPGEAQTNAQTAQRRQTLAQPAAGHRIVKVPGWGFALQEPSLPPRRTRRLFRKPRQVATEWTLKTNLFEARIHPRTGGLLSLRSLKARPNLLSQQVASRLADLSTDPDQPIETLYSQMVVQKLAVLDSDEYTGAIESRGVLLDRQENPIAAFRQVFRAHVASPTLILDVELEPQREPRADPWNSYYACRFAWGDDTALVSRSLHETRQRAEPGRWEAPLYIEIDRGHARVAILTGGLPFHRLLEGRYLDCLLIARGESRRKFRLGIAVDVPHPVCYAYQLLLDDMDEPLSVTLPETVSSGWLFHVGMQNIVATSWAAIWREEQPVGFRVGLLETAGVATETHLSAFRPIATARQIDVHLAPCGDLPVEDGKIRLAMAPYTWLRIEAFFA